MAGSSRAGLPICFTDLTMVGSSRAGLNIVLRIWLMLGFRPHHEDTSLYWMDTNQFILCALRLRACTRAPGKQKTHKEVQAVLRHALCIVGGCSGRGEEKRFFSSVSHLICAILLFSRMKLSDSLSLAVLVICVRRVAIWVCWTSHFFLSIIWTYSSTLKRLQLRCHKLQSVGTAAQLLPSQCTPRVGFFTARSILGPPHSLRLPVLFFIEFLYHSFYNITVLRV